MNILLLDENCMPSYANDGDSGFDLKSRISGEIKPGEILLVPTGVCFEILKGFEIQVRSRSGIALKHSCFVLNSPGTIDSTYRGEVGVILANFGKTVFQFQQYSKIAQGIMATVSTCRFDVVSKLSATSRGHQGFGSTGI